MPFMTNNSMLYEGYFIMNGIYGLMPYDCQVGVS